MIDDDLVSAIWPQRSLNGLSYGSTSFYITDYGAVFGFIAKKSISEALGVFYVFSYFWYPCLNKPPLGALGIDRDILEQDYVIGAAELYVERSKVRFSQIFQERATRIANALMGSLPRRMKP